MGVWYSFHEIHCLFCVIDTLDKFILPFWAFTLLVYIYGWSCLEQMRTVLLQVSKLSWCNSFNSMTFESLRRARLITCSSHHQTFIGNLTSCWPLCDFWPHECITLVKDTSDLWFAHAWSLDPQMCYTLVNVSLNQIWFTYLFCVLSSLFAYS